MSSRGLGGVRAAHGTVGIFADEEAIVRLVGAILRARDDEWAIQRACSTALEAIAQSGDHPLAGLPAVAA